MFGPYSMAWLAANFVSRRSAGAIIQLTTANFQPGEIPRFARLPLADKLTEPISGGGFTTGLNVADPHLGQHFENQFWFYYKAAFVYWGRGSQAPWGPMQ